MKKISLFVFALFLCSGAFALDMMDRHIHTSRFWSNSFSVSARPAYALSVTGEFDVTDHDAFDNHTYALRLPVMLRLENTGFIFKPFFYPDNGNGADAYGAKLSFTSIINRDEINQAFTRVMLSAAVAKQKADVYKNGAVKQDDGFYQAAYEAALNFNFFEQYGFDISGSVYQYFSGISGVEGVAGVMNQQELADLGTLDYVLGLPKFAAGAKILWVSAVSRSDNYIGYKYIDFYNNGAAHSLMLNSTVNFYKNVYFNLAYNHLFVNGGRDLYGAGIMVKF
jgi:hypothetical protein